MKLAVVLGLLASVVASGATPAKASSKTQVQVVSLADVKWEPSSGPEIPPGAMFADSSGDEAKGPSARYVKYPPGYTFPSHWHSATETDVVLVGKPQYTIDGKTYDAAPGSYLVIPAKVHHHLKCGAESECVVLYRWAGPLDFHFDK